MGTYIAGASHTTLIADRTEALLEPWLTRAGQAAFYAQIAQADVRHTDEVADRLGQVRCPTTVLWGEHDAWIPVGPGTPARAGSTRGAAGHHP